MDGHDINVGSRWLALELRHMDDDYVELQVVAVDGRRVTLDDAVKLQTDGVLRRSDVRRTTMDVARLLRRYERLLP